MLKVERLVTRPERYENILFKCVTGTTELHPDKVFTHYYPPSTERREVYTPNSLGSHHVFKDFDHYKCVVGENPMVNEFPVYSEQWGYRPNHYLGVSKDPYAGHILYGHSGTYQPFGDPGQLDSGLPEFYLEGPDGRFIPPPDDLDNLLARSLRNMTPSIKAELSSLNSLWELKDLTSLRGTVRNVYEYLSRPSFVPFKSFKRAIGVMMRQKREDLRVASDVYLQWSFNIGPLISDILGVYRALLQTERRINDLVSRTGSPQVRHFTTYLQENTDVADEPYPYDGWFDADWRLAPAELIELKRSVEYDPTTFHVQMKYNFNYTSYQVEHARLLALLDAFGVNLNFQIIWNAIPWSFVVDWVLGVGQWLGSFKVENMKPQINILEFMWSVKRARRINVMKRWKPSSYIPNRAYPFTWTRLPVVYQSSYRRTVGLPSVSSFVTSGLDPKELSLGAALVFSRSRRRTGRVKLKSFRTLIKGFLAPNKH